MKHNSVLLILAGISLVTIIITAGGIWALYSNNQSERWIESGDDSFWRSQFSNAEDAYQHALGAAINSEQSSSAYARLCRLYEYDGELTNALESCQAALQLSPSDANIEARLGKVFNKMGNIVEAVRHGHSALQHDSTNMHAVAFLAVSLAQQSSENHNDDFLQADKLIELVLAVGNLDSEIFQSAGTVKFFQGDLNSAGDYYQDAINLSPDFAPYYSDLGKIKMKQNKIIEALEAYDKALELKPDNVQAYLGRGWVLWTTGNFDWAQRDFQNAILQDAKNPESWAGLGWSQLSNGANDEARLAFQLALSLDPENEEAQTGAAILNAQTIAMDGQQNNVDIQTDNTAVDNSLSRFDQSIEATVQVYAFNELFEVVNTCSGALITAEGMLLTSGHCMIDANTGQQLNSQELAGIGIVSDAKLHPEKKYRAKTIEIQNDKDIAILQIIADWDGNPISGVINLPFMTIGDSNTLQPGDDVWAIGFPGMGGDTLTISQGVVSGFVEKDGLMLIKTDLMTGSGSSGGMVVNQEGELVGIHVQSWSEFNEPNNRLSVECPINLVRPLIEKALQSTK